MFPERVNFLLFYGSISVIDANYFCGNLNGNSLYGGPLRVAVGGSSHPDTSDVLVDADLISSSCTVDSSRVMGAALRILQASDEARSEREGNAKIRNTRADLFHLSDSKASTPPLGPTKDCVLLLLLKNTLVAIAMRSSVR